MKKMLFIAVFAATSFLAKAQTSFGIQGGANFSSIHSAFDNLGFGDFNHDSKTKVGFLAGVVADINFGHGLSFRPELNYIQKGGLEEDKDETSNTDTKYKTVLGYAQLSPNFVYNFKAGAGKFFVGIGPEFSIGISGRNRIKIKPLTGSGNSVSDDQNIKFDGDANSTDDDEHLKRFDFGGNILAGYKMSKGLFASVGYTLGFANTLPNDDTFEENLHQKNRGFQVKIGYMFGGKMHK